MIKFSELKFSDLVLAEYDGQMKEGVVIALNGDEKQVRIKTEVQEFWFGIDQLHPIALSESQLFKLGFQKHENEDGSIKYAKGAFRMLLQRADGFTNFDIWYREDKRRITKHIMVHEFQNHYMAMTKVPLTIDEA